MTDNCWACTKMYWLNCKFVLDVGFACIILNFSWKSHIEKTYFYTSASLLTSFLLGSITTVKMSVIKKPQIQNDLFECVRSAFCLDDLNFPGSECSLVQIMVFPRNSFFYSVCLPFNPSDKVSTRQQESLFLCFKRAEKDLSNLFLTEKGKSFTGEKITIAIKYFPLICQR